MKSSNDCQYIVQFYGAIFKEGDCWISMQIMNTSLDKFYKYVYERQMQRIPENILGQITIATVHALNYLKEKLKIIHRDVKPSNILLHEVSFKFAFSYHETSHEFPLREVISNYVILAFRDN